MVERNYATAEIRIGGMHCAACALSIEDRVKALDGVSSAEVNLVSEKLRITFDPDGSSLKDVEAAIQKAGFIPIPMKTTLRIGGMTCAMCVQNVEKTISALPGVTSVSVNLKY